MNLTRGYGAVAKWCRGLVFGLMCLNGMAISSCTPVDGPVDPVNPVAPNYDSVTCDYRGFDASMVSYLEENGTVYYDSTGARKDVYALLKENGCNWIRLRVWVDPANTADESEGDCTLERTVAAAKRVKDAGLNLLVDFHLSDEWADPVNQKCPSAWASIDSASDMADQIKKYMADSMQAFVDADACPDMVQIGNETDRGILLSGVASDDVKGDISANRDVFVSYIKAASEGVKSVSDDTKIMLHVARGGNSNVIWWFGQVGEELSDYYDVIGLSYYAFFKSHNNVSALASNVKSLKETYGKEVVIAETSFAWTVAWENSDNVNAQNQLWYYSGEIADDSIPYNGLVRAAANLTDADGKIFSTIETETYTDSTLGDMTVVAPTVENQLAAVNAIVGAAVDAGAGGFFYWGGDWVMNSSTSMTYGSTMENQALFNYKNYALESMAMFGNGKKPDAVGVVVDGKLDAAYKNSGAFSTKRSSSATEGFEGISGLYVTNDDTNLYIAVKTVNGGKWWENDHLTILVDNVACTTGSASAAATGWLSSNSSTAGVGNTVSFAEGTTLEAVITSGVSSSYEVSTAVDFGSGYVEYTNCSASYGSGVMEYAIPLSSLCGDGTGDSSAGAKAGDVVRLFAATVDACWVSGDTYGMLMGDAVPSAVVTSGTVGGWANDSTDTSYVLDMGSGLEYTIK